MGPGAERAQLSRRRGRNPLNNSHPLIGIVNLNDDPPLDCELQPHTIAGLRREAPFQKRPVLAYLFTP